MTRADVASIGTIQQRIATGTISARTTCGRKRPKYASSGSIPWTATAAISALSAPSSACGSCRRRRSTSSSRSCDRTPIGAAPSRELERPRQHPTRAEDQHEQNELARDVVERRAVERARDDAGEQRCLEEDENRGRDPDGDVGAEQRSRAARARRRRR